MQSVTLRQDGPLAAVLQRARSRQLPAKTRGSLSVVSLSTRSSANAHAPRRLSESSRSASGLNPEAAGWPLLLRMRLLYLPRVLVLTRVRRLRLLPSPLTGL